MPTTRSWVFETTAPLDEFLRRFRRVLMERDLGLDEAKAHDLAVRRGRDRAFVTVSYAEEGVRLNAVVRGAWLGDEEGLVEALVAAGRSVQAELLLEHRNR